MAAIFYYVAIVVVSSMSGLLKADFDHQPTQSGPAILQGTAEPASCATLDKKSCISTSGVGELSGIHRNSGVGELSGIHRNSGSHQEAATTVNKRNSRPASGAANTTDYQNHTSINSRSMLAPLAPSGAIIANLTYGKERKVVATSNKQGLEQQANDQQRRRRINSRVFSRQGNRRRKWKNRASSKQRRTSKFKQSKMSFHPSIRRRYWTKEKMPTTIEEHKEKLKKEMIEKLRKNSERQLFEDFELFSNTTDQMRKQLLCEFRKVRPTLLTSTEFPFDTNERLGRHFPKNKFFQLPIRKHCALVASAGSILGSGLGAEIDTADHVVRFNAAPVLKWGNDVGTRTTLRLVNDFVMNVGTSNNSVLRDTTSYGDSTRATFLAWDFCNTHSRMSLHKCYLNPTSGRPTRAPGYGRSNGLGAYLDWAENYGAGRKIYHLQPEWFYSLVDLMQRVSPYLLFRASFPSTGFLGLALMLHQCEWLHLYHFIPTFRPGWAPCKYYFEDEPAKTTIDCSLTPHIHQRIMEPALYMMLNEAPDSEVYGPRGHVLIRGVVNLDCPD